MRYAKLVFLNCCETAEGIMYTDKLGGLAYAFLKAGVHEIVCYRGPLPDKDDTVCFVQAFYKEYLLSFEADTALKAAQLKMIEKGVSEEFWSAYSVIRQETG